MIIASIRIQFLLGVGLTKFTGIQGKSNDVKSKMPVLPVESIMPLKGQLKKKSPAAGSKKVDAEVKRASAKPSVGDKKKKKPVPISSPSSSDSEELEMRNMSDSEGSGSENFNSSHKVALFDSDDESGSEDAIKMEEPSSRKKSSSAKSDAIVSKYAKKSVGFTDDNSEWLQLKKEAKKQAKKIVKGDSSEESEESSPEPSDDEFDELNAAEFEDGSSSESDGDDTPAYESMERKAKKLSEKKRQMRAEALLEEKEQIARARADEKDAKSRGFEFPTPEIMVKEKELGVDMNYIKSRFEETLRVLSNFNDARDGEHTRKEYMQLLINDLAFYYGYNEFLIAKFLSIFSPSECAEFVQANEAHRPLTIRVNTLKTRRGDLLKALQSRGVNLEPIKWSKVAVQIFESSVPIGATPEYLGGHYMLQSASSMTAVDALNPQPDERILDMCAAPGGKTTYIAQCMKNTGTLVANDVHPERLKSLSANLHRLGVRNAIVTNYDGIEFPTVMGGFDRVLLDAPCTGTGVIARDASVKISKSQEDVTKLGQTQRRLILAAIDSIDANSPTGGILVYATCSITVEENEAIVDYALRKRFIKVIDSGMEFGKPGIVQWRHHRFNEQVKLARRYYPHVFNMDGFFICKIKKLQNGVREQQDKKRKREEFEERRKRSSKDQDSDEELPEFEEISDDEESSEEQVGKRSNKMDVESSSDEAPQEDESDESDSEEQQEDSDDEDAKEAQKPPKKQAKRTQVAPSAQRASNGKSKTQTPSQTKNIPIQETKAPAKANGAKGTKPKVTANKKASSSASKSPVAKKGKK